MGQFLLMAILSASTPSGLSVTPTMQRLDSKEECKSVGQELIKMYVSSLPWGSGAQASTPHVECKDLSTGKIEIISGN